MVLVPARGGEHWLISGFRIVLGCRTVAATCVRGVAFAILALQIAEIFWDHDTVATTRGPRAMTWPLLEVIDAHLDEPVVPDAGKTSGHLALTMSRAP